MAAGLPDDELEAQFAINVRLLEQLAGQLVSTVIAAHADHLEDEAIQSQIQRWQVDPFLSNLISTYRRDSKANPINSSWINLAYQSRSGQEIAR